MGKVNVYLKRSYIAVASLIGIIGALMLAYTLFTHGHLYRDDYEIEPTIYGLYGFSIATLLLAITGLFGACKKKKWALILFAVGMILSSLYTITPAVIIGLFRKPQVVKELKEMFEGGEHSGLLNDVHRAHLNNTQMELQCCGLSQGYKEWGNDIPESCICTEASTNPCVAVPIDSLHSKDKIDDQPVMVYKEPCLPYLIDRYVFLLNVTSGVLLGLTLLSVLSVVLSIIILCQLNKKEDSPAVVYSAKAKAGNYTTLTELI
ncbi:tetraspanin-8-like [Seriola dumerili]|uniref:Tetraspanin-8-like n=1 Tax=Seriola dumerili TaxID=41447 RepID=A0A3B4TTQ0_SERDU|nr:tetraspanin-8-like [Seriola dumerili]